MSRPPAVFNISPDRSFVDALARGIMARAGSDAQSLAGHIVLLPNRRAARVLREAFLRLSEGRALLLPRMHPLGDLDAEEILLRTSAGEDLGELAAIAPAISRVERQMLLARLILKTGRLVTSFDQAAAIAGELGTLLDQMQTEGIGFDRLSGIVPEKFSRHWQTTLEFLKIVTEHWPAILAERGVIDPAERRNKMLVAQAALWQKTPPEGTVIAAGSTGSVPAAADLLRVVARLPRGYLVLPGLDAGMDDAGWDAVTQDHPQYNLKRLIAELQVDRRAIPEWSVETPARVDPARVRLLSETLRPAVTTGAWQNLSPADIGAGALRNLSRIDCATPEEEASVIALILRGALEVPEKTAALITPDRNLAHRVATALLRWGIVADDSGGVPLAQTPPGLWFELTVRMVASRFAPLDVLACLKHALCGISPETVALLETREVLRGPRPAPGIAGIRTALAMRGDEGLAARLAPLLERLDLAVGPLAALFGRSRASFAEVLKAHVALAQTLADTEGTDGALRLWKGEAGESLASVINEAFLFSGHVPDLAPDEYIALMRGFIQPKAVRVARGPHPRISILGQIEARLFQPDLVVLGGLNEGGWPALPAHDPWMSRPMRQAVGLPSPERSIGLSAHDFMQAACSQEVYLTRALKDGGAPTAPARWLLRMETVLSCLGLELPGAAAHKWRSWAAALDLPAAVAPCTRPAPAPPVSARPVEMSVTGVERWMRDPYEVYARHILSLKALEPVDADPGADVRGEIIHRIFERFVNDHPGVLPGDAHEKLLACGRLAFDQQHLPPEVRVYWWSRFERLAPAFLDYERQWRTQARPLAVEVRGRIELDGFTLTAKADRIDRMNGGGLAILDYKTGALPSKKEINLGFSPQLPLEAVIAAGGGFDGIAPSEAERLVFLKLSGAAREPIKEWEVDDTAQRVSEARAGLLRLIAVYADPKIPYISRPRADHAPRYTDFAHLARIREWAVADDDDAAGEEAA